MLKSDIVSYIKIEKNNEFADVIDSIVDAYQKYYDKTGDMFCYHIDMNINYQIVLCARRSDEVVKELIDTIAETVNTHKRFKIFAKRITKNEIFIRFDMLGITMIVYGLFKDFDILKKYQINNKHILYYYEVLHKNIFYESYNVLDYFLPKLNTIMNELSDGKEINKLKFIKQSNNKTKREMTLFYSKYKSILKHLNSLNIIYVGAKILSLYYDYKIDGNIELVYTGNFKKLISKLTKYETRTSDFEYRGKYIKIDDLIIYNGYSFSYPYNRDGLFNIGTSPLLLKFIILDSIFDNKYSKKTIIDIYSRLDFNKELIVSRRSGRTISPYYEYNMNEFGKRPWNRSKVISPLNDALEL
jgi:hypothetical protein